MQSKSQSTSQLGPDPHTIPQANVYTEPWWRTSGCNPIPPSLAGGNAAISSSLECPNGGSESNDDQSLSNIGNNEEDDDAAKESSISASPKSGSYAQDRQHVASTVPAMRDDCLTPPPQLELVGHTIACPSNIYQDPYYGGMMAAYGHQPLGYPPFFGMPQARMPLPLEMTQEPVYVNAKQYQGILRRRQARAKAELERKLIKSRKPYLHESRHQHAMRRARGTGGRFARKNGGDTSNCNSKERGSSGPAHSSMSASSSGSEHLVSDSNETWNSSNSHQEARGSQMTDTCTTQNYVNGSCCYQTHSSLQDPKCPVERSEDGVCSGQQWGSISSSQNQASQRRLAMQ